MNSDANQLYHENQTYKTDQFMDAYDFEEGDNYNYATPIQPNTAELYQGQKVFVKADSRLDLPFKVLDEPVPVWSLIKKFVGKDLTKTSWPVIMNEPLTSL